MPNALLPWRRLGASVALLAGALAAPLVSQSRPDSIPGTVWTTADWTTLAAKVRWGAEHGLDTLPLGQAIARLGKTFVGATYTPGTLEVPGSERVVVNLRELDCVTFIENVLALVRFIRNDGIAALNDPVRARRRYEGYLEAVRYRGGVLDGYPSRLHYFSEWLADNERRGMLRQLSQSLGGVQDEESISFMTRHVSAYRQLADTANLSAIRTIEQTLTAANPRWFLPETRITAASRGIQDGDIIAATSTLGGLDVAHTGFALWQNGKLHLLHAPLVGRVVEISEVPLANRIRSIKAQDGIMVARVERLGER